MLEASEQRVLAKLRAEESPGTVSSLVRVQGTELLQRADMPGVEALGNYAVPNQPEALDIGANQPPIGPREGISFVPMYLSNRMKTIAGGSLEVRCNIVAKAILDL
ncbi:MAG: acyl-CoA dehydrogenase family protein [Pseudomonadota bacterium]|nr:acyl-CoA dehydrogenase family protein [Pseudomonadota bacterium]